MIDSKYTRFGQRVSETLKAQIPDQVIDSTTVDGLTATQIAAGVTKSTLGLASVENFSLKTSWALGDIPSAAEYATPAESAGQFNATLNDLFGSTTNGYSVFIDNGKATVGQIMAETVGPVVGTTELEACKTSGTQPYLYETVSQTVWVKSGSTYAAVAKTENSNYIKPGRFYYNKTTKRLFYAETVGSLVPF